MTTESKTITSQPRKTSMNTIDSRQRTLEPRRLVSRIPTRTLVLGLVSSLALGLATIGLGGCGGAEPEEPPAGAGSELEPVRVSTATAAYRPVGARSVVTGAVQPWRRTMPGSKIMGRVDRVPVQAGERVDKGALLVTLESRDLRAAVRQAEAAVAGAEAQIANAKAQYQRIEELYAKGSATEKSLEDATAGFRMAEAGLDQAEANLEAARVTLGYAEIRAPFAGWVVDKRVEAGDMVQPGAPLFAVEDLDPVKVIAEVPEREISGFSTGDRVTVEVAAVGYREEGEIVRLVPAGDPRSRTFRVEVVQPNPDGALKSWMFARVTLDEKGERRALMVPAGALVARGQLEGLFVVEEAGAGEAGGEGSPTARLRWVRAGERRGDDVEILSGLAEGERYVVDPPAGLVDGTPLEDGR
jgi:RND family efflux transporter MFP subunit